MSSLIKINLKKIASGKLLYRHRELNPVLCDNLEGWDKVGGVEVQEGGDIRIFWPIHIAIWQKPTQHWKAVILQLKINLKNNFIKSLE